MPGARSADDAGRGQREVTPPWRDSSLPRGPTGGPTGGREQLPLWPSPHHWPGMQHGLPGFAQGYPFQSGLPMINPLALAPPMYPPMPAHAYPRGRNAGDWRINRGEGDQHSGRSRSVRRYDWPSERRLSTHEPLDWICGDCYYVNFSRNKGKCAKCGSGIPPVFGVDPTHGGSIFVKDATGRP